MYWYPNRPTLIPPDPVNPLKPKPNYLNSLEKTGKYIAELKWNGDNCLIYTGPNPEFWNRHHSQLKYNPSPEVLEDISKLPPDCVINAELVHNKTKTIKHKLVCHCIMVMDNQPLLGQTWGQSRTLLETLSWGNNVILSQTWPKGFWKLFQDADGEIIEGIILKDPTGLIRYSATPITDVSWMLKVRKPCKKYSF